MLCLIPPPGLEARHGARDGLKAWYRALDKALDRLGVAIWIRKHGSYAIDEDNERNETASWPHRQGKKTYQLFL